MALVDNRIGTVIQGRSNEGALQRIPPQGGDMLSSSRDGVLKAPAGRTTLDEIYQKVVADSL